MKSLNRDELVRIIVEANNNLNAIQKMIGDGPVHKSVLNDIDYHKWEIKHYSRILTTKQGGKSHVKTDSLRNTSSDFNLDDLQGH